MGATVSKHMKDLEDLKSAIRTERLELCNLRDYVQKRIEGLQCVDDLIARMQLNVATSELEDRKKKTE
jgi:hypothetical protein